MIYLELFWSFFKIGLLSIGGGYAAMPIIQNQVIDIHHWLTMTQFTDIITIAEMTPGPIAINSASFVGIQVAGFCGAVIATVGCVFPSCIIVMVLAYILLSLSWTRYGTGHSFRATTGCNSNDCISRYFIVNYGVLWTKHAS